LFDGKRIICIVPCYNELYKINKVVSKVEKNIVDTVLIVDDGSTDGSPEIARRLGATTVAMGRAQGVGAAIRKGIEYAIAKKYDIIVIIAGNNKDNPKEIKRLLIPLTQKKYDFVQGSRFLKRGYYGKMPFYRNLAPRLHPIIFSIITRKRITESSNGFRAFKTTIFKDKRINIWQKWLDKYALEPYLYYKAVTLGYKTTEVPVTKVYPNKNLGYTKMKPIVGWWSIFQPLFYLSLQLRR